jgi:hypothetical protein
VVIAFENEVAGMERMEEGLTVDKAELILKKIEVQIKLEELNTKKRESRYSKG